MKINYCLVACDLNKNYVEFIPLVIQVWSTIVGVNVKVILIANSLPQNLIQYSKHITLFKPIDGIPSSFMAQCIRILYPCLFNDKQNIIISDMDLIPLQKKYYIDTVKDFNDDNFIVYRNVISDHNQYPICFCLANSTVWRDIFNIKSENDITNTLIEWYESLKGDYNISCPYSVGWALDQIKLFEKVNQWNSKTTKLILLYDEFTGFNRLNRSSKQSMINNCDVYKLLVSNNVYTDFHLPKPYSDFKDIIDEIIDLNKYLVCKKMKLLVDTTDYNFTINLTNDLNINIYDKPVIFHCYWNSVLTEKHLLSIKSCYFFNVYKKEKREIILWVDNFIENEFFYEIKKYASIKRFVLEDEKTDIFKNKNLNCKDSIAFYSDLVRTILLYKYGGCWFDSDIYFLRCFDPLFSTFENEIMVYQWENQFYPNNAIYISLQPFSDKLEHIIAFIIQRNRGWGFQDAQLTYDLPMDFLVLPCSWFDGSWIQNPYNLSCDDFFKNTDKVITFENFFKNAFCYHWHNRYNYIIEDNSIIKQLDAIISKKMERTYYFSLTSIPSRFEQLENVLLSLLNQTIRPQAIYVHIPVEYCRFGADFTLPSFTHLDTVIINRCKDYGSNTKFLPMLLLDEIDKDAPIIIVDDDCIYSEQLAESLLNLQSKYEGNVATCMFGVTHFSYFLKLKWEIYQNGQNIEPAGFRGVKEGFIDIFEGFGGVCLKKKFFKSDVFDFPCDEIKFCDDIWLSAHVLKNKYKIVVSHQSQMSSFFQDEVDALKNDVNKEMRDFVTMNKVMELYNIFHL